jgi:2-desacetyl-2-hydroxyethyl bacteriochlorophyllide A dehydrogenase
VQPTTAQAVQFTAPREVRIAPTELPAPGPGELIVKTSFSGISAGTELLAYRGELDPSTALDETIDSLGGSFSYPFSYGYSAVGLVEVGTDVVPAGTPVFAFHPHQDRFVAASSGVVILPADVDLRLATMFPLVETALQLSVDAGGVLQETVVVLGLGAVGLLTALLLSRAGAHVIASEPREWRRSIAENLGLDAVSPDELAGKVPTRGVPLLVETSGAPVALANGLALLAHEGTALVGSWYGTKPVSLPLGEHFHRRRLTIRSSQVSTIPAALQNRWDGDRRRAAARDLLAVLPLEHLATTEFAFDDAAKAYAAIDRGDPGLLHAALRY